MKDCEKTWHPVAEEGAPKGEGWYCVSIHYSDWDEEEPWLPRTEWKHWEAEDRIAAAFFELENDGFCWRNVTFDDLSEYIGIFKNTFRLFEKEGQGTYDAEITAWKPLNIPDSPYRGKAPSET